MNVQKGSQVEPSSTQRADVNALPIPEQENHKSLHASNSNDSQADPWLL